MRGEWTAWGMELLHSALQIQLESPTPKIMLILLIMCLKKHVPLLPVEFLRDLEVGDGRDFRREVDDEALGQGDLSEGDFLVHLRPGGGQVGRHGLRDRGRLAVWRDLQVVD